MLGAPDRLVRVWLWWSKRTPTGTCMCNSCAREFCSLFVRGIAFAGLADGTAGRASAHARRAEACVHASMGLFCAHAQGEIVHAVEQAHGLHQLQPHVAARCSKITTLLPERDRRSELLVACAATCLWRLVHPRPAWAVTKHDSCGTVD